MPKGKWPDQAGRLPSGRVEWLQQSALCASLAGGPENRQYWRQLGIHLGNPGQRVFLDRWFAFLGQQGVRR
jgi:hypothetical protein